MFVARNGTQRRSVSSKGNAIVVYEIFSYEKNDDILNWRDRLLESALKTSFGVHISPEQTRRRRRHFQL